MCADKGHGGAHSNAKTVEHPLMFCEGGKRACEEEIRTATSQGRCRTKAQEHIVCKFSGQTLLLFYFHFFSLDFSHCNGILQPTRLTKLV